MNTVGRNTSRPEVVAFKFTTTRLWLDFRGSPLTEAAAITERMRRLNFGQLEIEITVDDPKAYTKPWTVTLNQVIRLNTDLLDKIMNENEKDLQHIVPK
jgi:hypothetical protein